MGNGETDIEEALRQSTNIRSYPDLPALQSQLHEHRPEVVLVPVPDGAASSSSAIGRLSALLELWTSDVSLVGIRLMVVTRGAVAVGTTSRTVNAAHAPVWGLVRHAQRRFGGSSISVVDLDNATGAIDLLHRAHAISVPELALRGGLAYTPAVTRVPVRYGNSQVTGQQHRQIDKHGTVLVIGADSPLAPEFTQHLVSVHCARNLLLTSLDGHHDPASAELLDTLTRLGATVRLEALDVRQRSNVTAMLARVETTVTTIIFIQPHSVEAETESLDAVFNGVSAIDEFVTESRISLVFLSDNGSILGGAGSAAQSAASAYLDAIAQNRWAAHLPALSLSWGQWSPSQDSADRSRSSFDGVDVIPSATALGAFDVSPMLDSPVLLSMALGTHESTENLPQLVRGLFSEDHATGAVDSSVARAFAAKLSGLSEADGIQAALEEVKAAVAQLLALSGAHEVQTDQAFTALGLTSTTAVQLRNKLAEKTGVTLPATSAFDYPTPEALAKFLYRRILNSRVCLDNGVSAVFHQ